MDRALHAVLIICSEAWCSHQQRCLWHTWHVLRHMIRCCIQVEGTWTGAYCVMCNKLDLLDPYVTCLYSPTRLGACPRANFTSHKIDLTRSCNALMQQEQSQERTAVHLLWCACSCDLKPCNTCTKTCCGLCVASSVCCRQGKFKGHECLPEQGGSGACMTC